jgi:hypothetical protein
MCKELFKTQTDVTALKNDVIQMENQTKYILHQIEKRPDVTKCFSGDIHARQALLNLNTIMDANKPPAGTVYRVTASDYINILKKYDLAKNWSSLDALYHGAEWNYQLELVNWDWTNKRAYLAEYGDCDDFGFFFKAHMAELAGITGIMWVIDWSGGHSYNLIFKLVTKNNDPLNPVIDIEASKAIVFEPQTDEWEEIPQVAPVAVTVRWSTNGWSPEFPKWQALKAARVDSIADSKIMPRDLNPKMYPLKDCILMM